MLRSWSLAASAVTLLLVPHADAGLYAKNSAVLQVDAKSYNRLITQSNHTSIVEFYAPWCGHCQKLAPAYEKAAKNLKGLAKVAGINCDDEYNKPFCGQMGVKGFPTLKIVRPSKKVPGRPTVEDYLGDRTAKAIIDAVVGRIPNHVKKVTDNSLQAWLKESNETAKAILFTEKGNISALLRALAIDYLGTVNFGQIRNKEAAAVETFGIEKYPTFVVLPGGSSEPLIYDGDLKKEPMRDFLKQVATPNPDPAPEPAKKKGKKKTEAKTDTKQTKVSEGDKPTDSKVSEEKDQPAPETPKDAESEPEVQQKAIAVIPAIDEAHLKTLCLTSSSKICALILLPTLGERNHVPAGVLDALKGLGEVYDKHSKRHSSFPFYIIEPNNPGSKTIRDALGLKDGKELEIIAINAKRMWWRRYAGEGYGYDSIEAWVDTIRMNEGKREKLPKSLISDAPDEDDEDMSRSLKESVVDEDTNKIRDEL
jgi:protein disulfide-isomerase A6